MRVLPLKTIIELMKDILEHDLVPALPAGYPRAQAIGLAAMCDQLVGRVEERCDLIQQDNQEMREVLSATMDILDTSAPQERLRAGIELTLRVEGAPAEENLALRTGLSNVIQAIAGLGLPPNREEEAVLLIGNHLRAQLDRERAAHRPTNIGKVFAETSVSAAAH